MTLWTFLATALCLLHSAMFSGLNLGFFGLSRLRLEIQAERGDKDALRILELRRDSHFLLATIVWGNVASNVLIALLTESFLTGIYAFLFSTIGITLFGEILPQAYLTRHALRASVLLAPMVRFYQSILFVVAKPTGLLLDAWLGKEETYYFREDEIAVMLRHHAQSHGSELAHLEAQGAVNFLQLDDILVEQEGQVLHPRSLIVLPTAPDGMPVFPDILRSPDDPFLRAIQASGEKWVVISDTQDRPLVALDADRFLRDALYERALQRLDTYCHRPIVVTTPGVPLGQVILNMRAYGVDEEDDVIGHDAILYWTAKEKRIITGADILGRLLRGIAARGAPTGSSEMSQ